MIRTPPWETFSASAGGGWGVLTVRCELPNTAANQGRQPVAASKLSKASSRVPTSSARPSNVRGAPGPQSVDEFLADLEHPFKAELLTLRQVILGAHPAIGEGVKWNAPSFRTTEYFATFHLRAKDGVQVILHLGAKKRPQAGAAISVADPQSLLQWLGPDRASVKFSGPRDIEAKRGSFSEMIRDWIKHV